MFIEVFFFRTDTKEKSTHIYSSKPIEENKSKKEKLYEMLYPLVLIAYQ